MKLEYVWLDGYNPQNLRSKVKIVKDDYYDYHCEGMKNIKPHQLDKWNFDGSSTEQSNTENSDCVLNPVFLCKSPFEPNSYIVLCEVLNSDMSPHASNTRSALKAVDNKFQSYEPLFGIEQEFFLYKNSYPLGFRVDAEGDPIDVAPQGQYYCSVGAKFAHGRNISIEHANACINAGLSICGTNSEVAIGQWEYQIGTLSPLEVADQLWVSRYLLEMIGEKYGIEIVYHPKPMKGDWNGSGAHTNFSTNVMREQNGLVDIYAACKKLEKAHSAHMPHYGQYNKLRMTGKHETSSFDKFKVGNSDRSCSVRIPITTLKEGKGYFEDRRPAANMDPYTVCRLILETTLG